eukprot:11395700-Alexandrium_andersonii.AAC.1
MVREGRWNEAVAPDPLALRRVPLHGPQLAGEVRKDGWEDVSAVLHVGIHGTSAGAPSCDTRKR